MTAFGVELPRTVETRAASRGDVDLTADNGLDSGVLTGAVEVDDAVHHAVVGNRASRLSQFFQAFREFPYPARAVEQTVFGV